MWLIVPFLLLVTYFLLLMGKGNKYSTANYTDTLNNVSINRVSGSLRRPGNEIGATIGTTEVSNAGTSSVVLLGEYQEELPTKNDGTNGLASTKEEPIMDSETVIISNDCEVIILDVLLELPAGTIIKKTDIGTIVHVGENGALLTRIDGTVLDFPPDSVMEFHSIHSVKDFLDNSSNVDVTNASDGISTGCNISTKATLLMFVLSAMFAQSDKRR
jgi:hypothetical protein